MPKFKIRHDAGWGETEWETIEAENKHAAIQQAYNNAKEEWEDNCSYEAEPVPDDTPLGEFVE